MRVFSLSTMTAVAIIGGLLAMPVTAAELPKTHIKLIGQHTTQVLHRFLEKSFFGEEITKMSNGAVTVDLVPYDTVGLKGPEVLRLMKAGALDFTSNGLTYLVGDAAEFEGCDLAGLTADLDASRKACNAYKETLSTIMERDWNSKLLAFGWNPPQGIWCSKKITSLDDLKGKKVRVYNTTLTDFVEGMGATAVTIPYVDVVPALQRGVTDCAITGTLNGNLSKWFEVAKYLMPTSIGWAPQYWAINLDTWNKYPKNLQDFMLKAFKELEDRALKVAKMTESEGETCNSGKGKCELGIKSNVTLVQLSSADKALRKKIISENVVPNWAKRCGSACAKNWNATVGKVLGVTAPTSF